jgi:hypothetical protein
MLHEKFTGKDLQQGLLDGSITIRTNGHYGTERNTISSLADLVDTEPSWPEDTIALHRRNMAGWFAGCFGVALSLRSMQFMTMDVSEMLPDDQITPEFRATLDKTALRLEEPIRGWSYGGCGECGDSLKFVFDGHCILIENPCPVPGGAPPVVSRIHVPSGRIVFTNDMRGLVPDPEDEHGINVNSALGQAEYTRAYEDLGLILMFTGNTGPNVYVHPDGTLTVETGGYDPLTYEVLEPSGIKQGHITTDLWWFSAMDHDRFWNLVEKKRKEEVISGIDQAGRFTRPVDEWLKYANLFEVDVTPGTWEFRGPNNRRQRDTTGELFATARLVTPEEVA